MSNTDTDYLLLLFIYHQTDPILPYANFVFPGEPSHLLQVSEVIRILTYERFKDDLFCLSLDTYG